MRIKTLAITALALLGLVVPASAGAQTLIGSGSVAAQPVLQALFKAYESQNKGIHFTYTALGSSLNPARHGFDSIHARPRICTCRHVSISTRCRKTHHFKLIWPTDERGTTFKRRENLACELSVNLTVT